MVVCNGALEVGQLSEYLAAMKRWVVRADQSGCAVCRARTFARWNGTWRLDGPATSETASRAIDNRVSVTLPRRSVDLNRARSWSGRASRDRHRRRTAVEIIAVFAGMQILARSYIESAPDCSPQIFCPRPRRKLCHLFVGLSLPKKIELFARSKQAYRYSIERVSAVLDDPSRSSAVHWSSQDLFKCNIQMFPSCHYAKFPTDKRARCVWSNELLVYWFNVVYAQEYHFYNLLNQLF